ncbi:prolyl oligopeptidase family serine peptidase [Novipirellula artificiosorum]|nr:prolyl oligopeptidase family serine peptidase [Novipirellula artificiosorum]
MGFLAVLVCSCPSLLAQGTLAEYEHWESLASRIDQPVFADKVKPNWIDESKGQFWYQIQRSEDNSLFVLVDATQGARQEFKSLPQLVRHLSDSDDELPADLKRDSLAPNARIQRSRDGGQRTEIHFKNETDEPLRYKWVNSSGGLVEYGKVEAGATASLSTFDGHSWVLETEAGQVVAAFVAAVWQSLAIIDAETPRPEPLELRRRPRDRSGQRHPSPDGQWHVEFANHNVVLVNNQSNNSITMTHDGMEQNGYGGNVWWSPDSAHFVVFKTTRIDVRTIPIVESSPKGSIHSKLLTVKYAKPGDPVDHDRPVLLHIPDEIERQEGDTTNVAQPIEDSLFSSPYSIGEVHWHKDSTFFSFVYNQRGHQVLRVIAVDAETAEPRVMIDEQSETFVCYSHKKYLRRLDQTDEAIWMSERSGWNHLYLIDQQTGDVKNAITSGPWVVRDVERVDEENRQVWLTVSGIDPDQDPYYKHLVRVDFDGSHLVRFTSANGDHRWVFSPEQRYLIDSYSRVDLPPVSVLCDANTGDMICELEHADASQLLNTGWRYPERFVAKGRDGVTDIFGIVIRPTHFDPSKTYPVLEAIYAGPHAAFVPKSFGRQTNLQKMAELGFIIVKMDGMGTSYRSKAFHDVCWKNLGDSGFADRIAWIKAAAKEHPEMDLTRVGIWGGSAGGQSAMRALIAHGDFYHAAVADCGCHDNRVDKMWWNEQWMGYPIESHYAEQSNVTQAHRMQGDLMLIVGELDHNVDPASTMQVVHALVKADKDFELLLMPGVGHGAAGHPYAERRQADFFVRKLWKREPRNP